MQTRSLILAGLFFLICLNCKANDRDNVIAFVYKWNDLHNTKNAQGFRKLYADEVQFYGQYFSRETCIKKKAAFLQNGFHQKIISPVRLTWYLSGTVRCAFTKQTKYKRTVKEYDAYLLLKKENDRYVITSESDLTTDSNLGLTLDLGEEKPAPATDDKAEVQSSNTLKNILIGCLLFGLIGYLIFKRKGRRQVSKNVISGNADFDEGANEVNSTEEFSATATKQANEKEKGDVFEKYVVARFTPEYFTLLEWRGDKYHNGIYASSNKLPDLEYEYKSRSHHVHFAVECKWRSGFIGGQIKWAKETQLQNYRDFHQKRRMEVFVIIGVGGKPDHPEQVFIIPLNQIQSDMLTENELKKYRRYKKGDFYLNANVMSLE